ncbi:geraniol 8-hydroxylase-like [Arachis ipaensis]|uniref:Cytochrome P450 n=1 Tax=Arachis hypogaea TaxID=3818 RepID=A0A445E9I9_ARAHY|nr:geraniol 8-hydroxylase-like [Arachis ipaensis]XP_025634209.1 geraniol 8-hydroxylase-like [Arachis hypogaea]RYR71979.1 hypothetical protein Ahy_A02g006189 [Arachis hypogaea]
MDYILLLLFFFMWLSIHTLISKLVIKTSKSLKLPPGPNPFPIIGNILELGKHPHKSLTKLSQIYGPIMTLKLGNLTTIVISSPQLAKEVLHKNDQNFSYRTVPDTVKAHDHHIYSVGWMQPSSQWRILRKICATKVFSSQQLDSTQVVRQRKVKELIDFVKKKSETCEVLNISEAIFTTVLNSISNTLFSIDVVQFGSSKSQEFKDIFCGITEEAGKPNVVDYFPIFRKIDPQGAHARMTKYYKKMINFLDGIVEERLRLLKGLEMDTKEYKDVLDYVLEVMLEDNSQINRIHVLHLLVDLFVAGIDTTASTIEWAMTELLYNPKKLQKVKNELEDVVGKEQQQIEEKHISKLPFLRAVVKETFRLHPPFPLIPHKSKEDVELCGFNVPKNAQVLINIWGVGRDSSIWRNPDEFIPERFLESRIDYQGNDCELIPFSAGRRMCPGLPLAYRGVHTVLGSLLLCYDWKLVKNGQKEKDLDMSEKFGLSLHKAKPLQAIPMQSSSQ